jgi:hypothetical protein
VPQRLPAQGFRQAELGSWDKVYYAVELSHPDPGFGAYASQNEAKLLQAADGGIRIAPPYQWRDDEARAKTEKAIQDELQKLLAKDRGSSAPLAKVKLVVERVEHRPRRTAGVPPRHSDGPDRF